MNYSKIYDALMTRASTRKLTCYSELHHIIPRCMNGGNESSNIVRLTAKEHYVAHHLLFMIYRTTKLAHAWFSMLRSSPSQKRVFTASQYEAARKAHVDALKKSMSGSQNHFYGRRHSAETKKKISIANTGSKRSQKDIDWFVENVAKQSKSAEHRKKIGRSGMINLKNTLTGESIRIDKIEALSYDREIWKSPSSLKQKKEKCIHCNIETVSGNIKRWHNENCKYNPSRKT